MAVDGYLLDTNHIIPLLRGDGDCRTAILRRMAELPEDSPVYIATATLAELEVGCCCLGPKGDFDPEKRWEAQEEIRDRVRANKLSILEFTRHTAAEYGSLKAALMRKYNRGGMRNAAKWPEGWTSPDKGKTLGVDEFDLLIISHAIERNLVLVTTDPMLRICEGIGEANEVPILDDWMSKSAADR